MTTILYWGRLFPVTIKRMRFSLSQLSCCHGWDVYPVTRSIYCSNKKIDDKDNDKVVISTTNNSNQYGLKAMYVHSIHHDMSTTKNSGLLSDPFKRCNAPPTTNSSTTPISNDPTTVTGYIIQHQHKPSSKILFYLYGGAYLGGDSLGNLHYAEKISQQSASSHESIMDIFVPNYRLLPEYTFFDALYDVCLSFEYLVLVKGYHPKDIILFGISSGGGLCIRLMQRIIEFQKAYLSCNKNDKGKIEKQGVAVLTNVPRGAVLMSPFVDYTEPKGSFLEYTKHDLIVNEVCLCFNFIIIFL